MAKDTQRKKQSCPRCGYPADAGQWRCPRCCLVLVETGCVHCRACRSCGEKEKTRTFRDRAE
ncbi:hypothetical protein [Candidatus Desulforudis audaxviator]|uniref:hypothetical protein n=1 Tax=Candidatus Desulforudis audaxviator TaxID=471827 RepID=UPI00107DCAE3|nr:hypothetical protein [Candidatus Desulforudis audaxviator]AZK60087.1 hypothetical protein Daudx_1541 [Candidatus Desulforudis audaxviator]